MIKDLTQNKWVTTNASQNSVGEVCLRQMITSVSKWAFLPNYRNRCWWSQWKEENHK